MRKKFQWTMLISFQPKPVVTFLRFDYSIASSFFFISVSVEICHFSIEGASVHGQSVRRFPQFPIHFLASLPPFFSFFMITLLHFPLWSFHHISDMSLVRYTSEYQLCPFFYFFFEWPMNGKPLMEFKWNYFTHLHTHINDVSQTKIVQPRKKRQ